MDDEPNSMYELKQKLKKKDDELHNMRVEMLALYTRIKDMESVDNLKAELVRKNDEIYHLRIKCIGFLEDLRDRDDELEKSKRAPECDDEIVRASRHPVKRQHVEQDEEAEKK